MDLERGDQLGVWRERNRWHKRGFGPGRPPPRPPRPGGLIEVQTRTLVSPRGPVWGREAPVRHVPPTVHRSTGSLLPSPRRQRGLSRPLAGRQSKGTFPRIVSNRTLLKMRLDFTGHVLETKTINRFLRRAAMRKAALTGDGNVPGPLRRAGEENHLREVPQERTKGQQSLPATPSMAKQSQEPAWGYLNRKLWTKPRGQTPLWFTRDGEKSLTLEGPTGHMPPTSNLVQWFAYVSNG